MTRNEQFMISQDIKSVKILNLGLQTNYFHYEVIS